MSELPIEALPQNESPLVPRQHENIMHAKIFAGDFEVISTIAEVLLHHVPMNTTT